MGYIKKVVQTGAEFADSFKMPEYVAKARESSKIIDVASEKIETFYCEKGSPLLTMVDELTASKIDTALAVANNKVEQAQTLKTAAAAKVQEKTTEAIEIAKQTKATALEKGVKAKEDGLAKYNQLKMFSSKKADETKTIMRKRIIYASEEASRLEQTLEKKLQEKASTNEYANKALAVIMTAKQQVKKSLSLPLTLQERMDKGLSFAKEQVKTCSVVYQAKKAQFVTFAYASYGKMTTDNALVYFRGAFGDDAARVAQEKLQALKKANVKGKVADKMKIAYKYSLYQVGQFADMAEKMETAYFGTFFISKLR
jgi:hypothetical protein